MDNATRLERLNRLLDVALAHQEHGGHDTPLNGVSRNFNMSAWDCGTSACLLGSYMNTPYGKQFFEPVGGNMEPHLIVGSFGESYEDAAAHFGITEDESRQLFHPLWYGPSERDEEHMITVDAVIARVRKIIAKYDDFNVQDVVSGRWSSAD